MRRLAVVVLALLPVVVLSALAGRAVVAATAAPQPAVPVAAAMGPQSGTLNRLDGRAGEGLLWLLPGDDGVALAPDGRRIAFSSGRDGNREIYVADASTGELTRVTRSPGREDVDPAWSPGGALLAWAAAGRTGRHDLWVAQPSGRAARRVLARPADDAEPDWAPDGRSLAFASDAGGGWSLWTIELAPGAEPAPLGELPGAARAPAWRPDGSAIAYTGLVGGDADVWQVGSDGLAPRRLVRGPGYQGRPAWSADGRHLGFLRGEGVLTPWLARADGTRLEQLSSEPAVTLDLGLAGPHLAPRADLLLPDLDQRPPAGIVVRGAERGRQYVGFASAVDNIGDGPLRIRGTRFGADRRMRADQLVESRGGPVVVRQGAGEMRFEAHPPHHHWHLEPFDGYELRRAADGALLRRDRKTGFCLLDRWGTAPLPEGRRRGPPRFLGDCAAGRPDARTVEEGSSVGYTDRYPQFFHGQEVEVTGIPAGLYVLVHRANPAHRMRELTFANDVASVLIRLRRPAGPDAPPTIEVLRACDRTDVCRPR